MGLNVVQPNRIDVSAKSKIWDYTAATLRCDTPILGGDAVNKDYVDGAVVGSISWGGITGTLANQVDLQAALDLKYDAADYNTDFDNRFALKDTGDLTEGANLYFTDARAITALTGQNISLFTNDVPYLTTETDPLSLHLDQTVPQTLINGVPLMTTSVDPFGSSFQLVNVAYVRSGWWLFPPIIDFYDPTGGLPPAPSVGDRYIAETTASGWTEDYVYEWDGGSWVESTPEEGWMIWEIFGMIFWVFFSGGWMEVGEDSFLRLDGSNANSNIDISAYDLITTGAVGRDTDNEINWGVDDSLAIVIGGTTHNIVSISDGAGDNDKLVTQGYVDDAVEVENLWDRDAVNGYIYPHTLTDKVGFGINTPVDLVHIYSGASSGTPNTNSILTLEGSSSIGMQFLSGNTTSQLICFGDADDDNPGQILYNHDGDLMGIKAGTVETLTISVGKVGVYTRGQTPSAQFQVGSGLVTQQWTGTDPYVLIQGVDNEASTNAFEIQSENLETLFKVSTVAGTIYSKVDVNGLLYVENNLGIGTTTPLAQLHTTAGRIVATTRVTTTYTILVTDHHVFCDTDGGAFTATLPAGVDGQTFRIINCGSSGNDITIAPDGAELLTGANASRTLSDSSVIILTYQTNEGWF